ncbi:hypothetical protein PV328_012156, partial [Microctonus aethiopoides]
EKEFEIQRVQEKGFYFQNHPETTILNERKAPRRKGFLLINGLQCKLIGVKNPRLWKFEPGIVEESLKSEIRQSDLAILKFTSNFLKTGLTKDILFKRFQTLNEFHAIDKQCGSTSIHPYILDAEDLMTGV